jgi:hypothetical protein
MGDGVLSAEASDPSRAVRPYTRDREGSVFGEGAVALCLERESRAEALADAGRRLVLWSRLRDSEERPGREPDARRPGCRPTALLLATAQLGQAGLRSSAERCRAGQRGGHRSGAAPPVSVCDRQLRGLRARSGMRSRPRRRRAAGDRRRPRGVPGLRHRHANARGPTGGWPPISSITHEWRSSTSNRPIAPLLMLSCQSAAPGADAFVTRGSQ